MKDCMPYCGYTFFVLSWLVTLGLFNIFISLFNEYAALPNKVQGGLQLEKQNIYKTGEQQNPT